MQSLAEERMGPGTEVIEMGKKGRVSEVGGGCRGRALKTKVESIVPVSELGDVKK